MWGELRQPESNQKIQSWREPSCSQRLTTVSLRLSRQRRGPEPQSDQWRLGSRTERSDAKGRERATFCVNWVAFDPTYASLVNYRFTWAADFFERNSAYVGQAPLRLALSVVWHAKHSARTSHNTADWEQHVDNSQTPPWLWGKETTKDGRTGEDSWILQGRPRPEPGASKELWGNVQAKGSSCTQTSPG